MHLYVFTGVVTPERAWLELPTPLNLEFSHIETSINGSATIEIYKNQVIYSLKTELPIYDIFTAKNIVSDQIQEILDSICINSTVACIVDVRSLYNSDNGQSTVFGVSEPSIGTANEGHERHDILPTLLAVSKNRFIRRAIADFRSAIRYPGETGFFTYRAVESLIQDTKLKYELSDRKKPEAIAKMARDIGFDPSDVEFLRLKAADIRHGKPIWISGEDRLRCLSIARAIILKYIACKEIQ